MDILSCFNMDGCTQISTPFTSYYLNMMVNFYVMALNTEE